MSQSPKFYKCPQCGNLVGVILDSGENVVCCGQPMVELKANVTEASTEKHLPVAEIDGDTLKVQVGSVAHPMLDEHFIMWICVMSAGRVQRVRLDPHQKPEAVFVVPESGDVEIYEYCNLHGLWKTTVRK